MPHTNETMCLVCYERGGVAAPRHGDFLEFTCARCGAYTVSGTLERLLELRYQDNSGTIEPFNAVLSHRIRRSQQQDLRWFSVLREEYDELARFHELPKPAVQRDNLVLWLGERSVAPGKWLDLTLPRLIAEIGALDEPNVTFVLSGLESENLIEIKYSSGQGQARLTQSGWLLYEGLVASSEGDSTNPITNSEARQAMTINVTTINSAGGDVTTGDNSPIKKTHFDLQLQHLVQLERAIQTAPESSFTHEFTRAGAIELVKEAAKRLASNPSATLQSLTKYFVNAPDQFKSIFGTFLSSMT